jgi:hypothetical protein
MKIPTPVAELHRKGRREMIVGIGLTMANSVIGIRRGGRPRLLATSPWCPTKGALVGLLLSLADPGRESCLTASKRKFFVCWPRILACAVIGWLAASDRGSASDDLILIKSITFAGHTLDRAHPIRWQDWTIGFGKGRPFSEYDERGTTLRGLSCASPKVAALKCHLFMSMKPVESRPHFCELSADDPDIPGSRPMRIDCPNEIRFLR